MLTRSGGFVPFSTSSGASFDATSDGFSLSSFDSAPKNSSGFFEAPLAEPLSPSSHKTQALTAQGKRFADASPVSAFTTNPAIRLADEYELYQQHSQSGHEVSLFQFGDGTACHLQGETFKTDSLILATGDEDADGTVSELNFAAHINPGLPGLSSEDASLLAARALKSPDTLIRHRIYGHGKNGEKAFVALEMIFDSGRWSYRIDASSNLTDEIADEAAMRLEMSFCEAIFEKPETWDELAWQSAHAPLSSGRQTLGETLIQARALLAEHGITNTVVSLREVGRIRNAILTYAPHQGFPRAVAKALWLTLCASLTPEQRESDFGKALFKLITLTEIAGPKPGAQEEFRKELERLARTNTLPVPLDFTKNIDEQFLKFKDDAWAEVTSATDLALLPRQYASDILALFSPEEAFENLERALFALPNFSDTTNEAKLIRIAEAVSRLTRYAAGEPVWADRALKLLAMSFVKVPDESARIKIIKALIVFRGGLEGEQRETAEKLIAEGFENLSLVKFEGEYSDSPTLRMNAFLDYAATLDDFERGHFLSYAFRKLKDWIEAELNLLFISHLNKATSVVTTLGKLSLMLTGSEREEARALLQKILSGLLEKKWMIPDDFWRCFRSLSSAMLALTQDQDEALLTLRPDLEKILQSDKNFNKAQLHAADYVSGALGYGPGNALLAEQWLLKLKNGIFSGYLSSDDHAAGLRVVATLIGQLKDSNRGPWVDFFVKQIENILGQNKAVLVQKFSPALLTVFSAPERQRLSETYFWAIDAQFSNYSFVSARILGIERLIELSYVLDAESPLWERVASLLGRVCGHVYIGTGGSSTDDDVNRMRQKVFAAIIELWPKLPAESRQKLLSRYENIYLKASERIRAIDEISLDGLARVQSGSVDEGDLFLNVKILGEGLAKHQPGIRADGILMPSTHFDRTLVTAHRLLNHVVQALTINRFVLVTGPSGIGKSECGRFVADRLNWPTSVFNCNRATTQEDMMQKIGITLHGATTDFVITDGPLADALLNGHLFILNEINLAKPGSLAFLFSLLADIGEEFDYYDARTGRVERRRIHPNFRMLATQNPDGPGRKDLNAALKNRAVEIHTPAYMELELMALLDNRFPALKTNFGASMSQSLVSFYANMASKMNSRVIGGHAEGYVWNLRHLLRLAGTFAEFEKAPTEASQILELLYDRVGSSFMPADRDVFFDEIKNYVYGEVRVKAADIQSFKEAQARLKLNDVYEKFGLDPVQAHEVASRMGLKDIPTSARYVRSILAAFQAGDNVWLKGPAGTGKTRLAEFVAAITGSELFVDTFTPQTDEAQLKGELKPRIMTLADGTERLGFEHIPAALVRALRVAITDPTKKIACLLDEAAFAKPDVLEELNSLLDRDGGLWVLSPDGSRVEFLERPDNFRLILSSNTYGYGGVSLQSEALRSRTMEIFMDFEFTANEIDVMLGSVVPLPDEIETPPVAALTPGVEAEEAPAVANGTPVVPPSAAQTPAGNSPVVARPPVPLPGGRGPMIPYFGSLQGAPSPLIPLPLGVREETVATVIALRSNIGGIRDKLKAAGMQVPEEVIQLMEEKFDDLHKRLLGAAVAMGRDPDVTLEFDLATQTASMTIAKPRTFRLGPALLIKKNVEDLLSVAQHEGAHADITRMPDEFFLTNEPYKALLFAVEDLRVNARVMDRAPGRTPEYAEMLRGDYSEKFDALKTEEWPELLPHEAFMNALFSKTYGGSSAWENDPVVGPALKKAWPAVLKAVAAKPREFYPTEENVNRHFARFQHIVREDILPIYDKLLKMSREELNKRQKDGDGEGKESKEGGASQSAGESKSSGSAGGKPSQGKNPEQTLDERSRQLADSLGAKTQDKSPDEEQGSSQSGATQSGTKSNGGTQSKSSSGNSGESNSSGSVDANGISEQNKEGTPRTEADRVKDYARQKKKDEKHQNEFLKKNTYSKLISSFKNLADRVFTVFDRLLKPNSDAEYEDRAKSGPRLDVERAVRAVKGALTKLDVFQKRSDPSSKNYRFSLLLDASGSMKEDKKERGGLGLAALFMDVFERLEIPYSLDAFNEEYLALKGFADNMKPVAERNRFFNELHSGPWGRGGTNLRQGVTGILERIRKERKTNPREREFLFVLTDGDETSSNGVSVREQCDAAAKEGIIVVGIGIGDGMDAVRKHFPIHLVEANPERLPELIAEFIREFVRHEMEEE